MSDNSENLDGEDTVILNRQGWNFVISYQTKEKGTGSTAYNSAMEKANSIDRLTGIRTQVKGEYTVFEVWEKW